MKVKEALVLFGFFSSAIATIVSQQCWYNVYVLTQARPVAEVSNGCLCPAENRFLVSQTIKNPNSDLERVVVFYYRDKTNNNMYMFTPGREKQLLIPEPAFGRGDELYKINSDLTLRPFASSTTAVNIEVHHPHPNIHKYPEKDTTHEKSSIFKVDTNPFELKDSKEQSHTIDYSPHPWFNLNQRTNVKDTVNTTNNNEVIKDGEASSDSSNGIHSDQHIIIEYPNLNDQKEKENVANDDLSNDVNYLQNESNVIITTNNENKFGVEEEVTVSYVDYSPVDFLDIKKDLNEVIMDQTTEHSYEQLKPVKKKPTYNKDFDILYEQPTERVPYEESTTIQITPLDRYDVEDDPVGNNFHLWYKQQAKHFSKLVSNDLQYFNIGEIEAHIVNLLQSNGYSVVHNRVLNANGESVNLNKYKLVRVIIRAPDDDQHVTSNVFGVMLVNMSPLTILGVVPLKTTFDETDIQGDEYRFRSLDSVKEQLLRMYSDEKDSDVKLSKKPSNKKGLLSNLGDMLRRIIPSSTGFEGTRRNSGEDVLPGFRIIGGNAATGSGTPITSRGRSAAS